MVIRAGKLRHRVIVEQATGGQNDYGEDIPAWATFATVNARIEPAGGAERFDTNTMKPETTHVVTIRYLDGLKTDMRLKFGTRILEILSAITRKEIKEMMTLQCKEAV